MKYCKIIDGVVIQTQRSSAAGFIECPEDTYCGMVKVDDSYENPAPTIPTPEEIEAKKDSQVELELGGDNIRILVETFIEVNGNTQTVDEVLALAKSKRKAEL